MCFLRKQALAYHMIQLNKKRDSLIITISLYFKHCYVKKFKGGSSLHFTQIRRKVNFAKGT